MWFVIIYNLTNNNLNQMLIGDVMKFFKPLLLIITTIALASCGGESEDTAAVAKNDSNTSSQGPTNVVSNDSTVDYSDTDTGLKPEKPTSNTGNDNNVDDSDNGDNHASGSAIDDIAQPDVCDLDIGC